MKIDLKVKRSKASGNCRHIHWTQSAPYFMNSRAILLHRVRTVEAIMHQGEYSHTHVSYWCANGTNGVGEFYHDPPTDRLLCVHCEANAVAHDQKSSQELTGRHVHTGKIRAERTCCKNEEN